jgi:hypothetical protein
MIRRRLVSRKVEDRFWLGLLYLQGGLFGLTWAGIFAYQRKYPGVEWKMDLSVPAPEVTWDRMTKEWPVELYQLFFVWDDVATKDIQKEVAIERNAELESAAAGKPKE